MLVSLLDMVSVFVQICYPRVQLCYVLHILSHAREWKTILTILPYYISMWLSQLSQMLL